MLYLLFGLLILLFCISYWLGGRDFFAPMTMQVIVFAFAVLSCIYFITTNEFSYKIHFNTVWLIFSCLFMSVLTGALLHHLFLNIKISAVPCDAQHVYPISGLVSSFVIILQFVVIIWSLQEIYRIGGGRGTFYEVVTIFRQRSSHSTDLDAQFPFVLRQLRHFSYTFFLLYGFNLLRFFQSLSFSNKIVNIVVIALCIVSLLLNGDRNPTIKCIIACVIFYHLLRIQRDHRYRRYSLFFLLRLFVICCAVLWGFVAVRGIVGRSLVLDVPGYIAYYTGPEIINLDMFLSKPIHTSGIFGKYTFFRLIANLRTLGILDTDLYTAHQEMRYIGGFNLGNVYTLFRIYYADFGIAGVYILHEIASIILSAAYEYVKKRRANVGILLFGSIYYTVVLSFFKEWFYSDLFSITFIRDVVLLIFLYKLVLQRKIRFTLGRKSMH